MIRIGVLGDIGAGKSYIASKFGYPVFNADNQVEKLYKKNIRVFKKLKKILPKFITSFPVNKNQIIKAILDNDNNIKKVVKVIHFEVKKEMNLGLDSEPLVWYYIDTGRSD